MRLTSPRSSDSLSSKFVRLMTNSPTRFTNSVKRSKSTRIVGLCGLATGRVGEGGTVGEGEGEISGGVGEGRFRGCRSPFLPIFVGVRFASFGRSSNRRIATVVPSSLESQSNLGGLRRLSQNPAIAAFQPNRRVGSKPG